MSDFRNDPSETQPQRRLSAFVTMFGVVLCSVIVFSIFAGCDNQSQYAAWDEKCENAFAHDRDINDCKALGRNNAVLVAK